MLRIRFFLIDFGCAPLPKIREDFSLEDADFPDEFFPVGRLGKAALEPVY